ncbi:hypothetical protein E2C01_099506 [Portunus trituberculatus]|uniref:Uncharacterized protein n=1 Tax=Portunus trituberculatus TaxID=210409 RepID=A0A5B7K407_PORTR|nr:hypothetical protein [Portunus trituberculatus]
MGKRVSGLSQEMSSPRQTCSSRHNSGIPTYAHNQLGYLYLTPKRLRSLAS